MSLWDLVGLGFVLGLRHALDADHLAAIATIVGRGQPFRRAARIGVFWGLGHTAALLGAAILMVVFRIRVPESTAAGFELGVAALLILLSLQLIRSLVRGDRLDLHPHSHGTHRHSHPHLHAPSGIETGASTLVHEELSGNGALPGHGPSPGGLRPFLIGILHGLAGSAALLLLTVATVSDPGKALLFVMVFGVGSIGGMLAMSSALSLPLVAAAGHSDRLFRALQLLIALGTLWVSFGMVREFAGG